MLLLRPAVSATLPYSMKAAEDLDVPSEVSSFVLPLGSTINIDGTAIYQGICAIFIANVFGLDLDLGQQITIVLTCTFASIGAAGIPGSAMVMLTMVLQSVGLPLLAGIGLVTGIDRITDMAPTATNITGDIACAVVVSAIEREGGKQRREARKNRKKKDQFTGIWHSLSSSSYIILRGELDETRRTDKALCREAAASSGTGKYGLGGSCRKMRLRVNSLLLIGGKEYFLGEDGRITGRQGEACIVTAEEIRETLEYVSGSSLYAFSEELRQGFLHGSRGTQGGRGGTNDSGGGKDPGNAAYFLSEYPYFPRKERMCRSDTSLCTGKGGGTSHAFDGASRCGKTTILRDLIRQISNGTEAFGGCTVGVMNSARRSEILSEIARTIWESAQIFWIAAPRRKGCLC